MTEILGWGDERVLVCDTDGPAIDTPRATTDLIGEAMFAGASVLAIPAARLGPAFFRLRSGLAGEIAQKAVNYRLKLAVIGDISQHLSASNALRDWVREADRGREIWFEPDLDSLAARLGGSAGG
ncbi:DUF4180 domain-containing protein [Inquilinus limosus]|uniref:Alpha/beta hydrolase n=1 Tax=Inquilinus limosus TaxID=171674 RepID=A0A211ZTH6_9PROT|nr:DUF4180 domain-containing protein [Inquilinus limosus]OWJ68565.1 alpha/beta hydrolase [Inquilinus limosus]